MYITLQFSGTALPISWRSWKFSLARENTPKEPKTNTEPHIQNIMKGYKNFIPCNSLPLRAPFRNTVGNPPFLTKRRQNGPHVRNVAGTCVCVCARVCVYVYAYKCTYILIYLMHFCWCTSVFVCVCIPFYQKGAKMARVCCTCFWTHLNCLTFVCMYIIVCFTFVCTHIFYCFMFVCMYIFFPSNKKAPKWPACAEGWGSLCVHMWFKQKKRGAKITSAEREQFYTLPLHACSIRIQCVCVCVCVCVCACVCVCVCMYLCVCEVERCHMDPHVLSVGDTCVYTYIFIHFYCRLSVRLYLIL
jgi:hypothetical protein